MTPMVGWCFFSLILYLECCLTELNATVKMFGGLKPHGSIAAFGLFEEPHLENALFAKELKY